MTYHRPFYFLFFSSDCKRLDMCYIERYLRRKNFAKNLKGAFSNANRNTKGCIQSLNVKFTSEVVISNI